jgi:demethylmenaquinone methyltransferase/2-methoxy-6-polyprenyl-1,4-benzoquinol methylase
MVANDGERAAHLERSRRVWDLWSRFYGLNDRDTEPIRRRAVETLDLAGGETVLDVGCGPGSNFELLRERVGPEGRVVGVDYSPKMVAKARERAASRGWDNVEVVRADATRSVVAPGTVDAAVATLAISAMPDAREACLRLAESLRPGGRVAVYDVRPVPDGPWRVFNPVVRFGFRSLANRNPEADVLDALGSVFSDLAVVETHLAGTNYVATAHRPA